MVYQISREYNFSAAHRIDGHAKCGRLHGHNYRVVVVLSCNGVDSQGMVLDYGDLDARIKPAIDPLDHRYLVPSNRAEHDIYYLTARQNRRFEDIVLLEVRETTAECIAEHLYKVVSNVIPHGIPMGDKVYKIYLERIEVWETLKSMATYSGL